MKIKELHLKDFKRFTDLTITDIPETAKMIVLVGPNGSGKTSVFEGFYHWYKLKGFRTCPAERDYYIKKGEHNNVDNVDYEKWNKVVTVTFHDLTFHDYGSSNDIPGKFHFRTAYRNELTFTTQGLSQPRDLKDMPLYQTLGETDSKVSENYMRLISNLLYGVFDEHNNNKRVEELRNEVSGKINESLKELFDDLQLSSLGDPLKNGSFYFTKGDIKEFHYKNLSAGEKSAFDLLLDIIIKMKFIDEAVFCIDEPETHMHTALQANLISEIYKLIPSNSQIWISTHSIGMLNKARELEEYYPGEICFIDFSNKDFDSPQKLTPSPIDKTIWNKFLELAFGDFSKLIAPKKIVLCEGNANGSRSKNFDATVYEMIFSSKYPDVSFVSIGSCNDIEKDDNTSFRIISEVMKSSEQIRLVDRDDRSEDEVRELNQRGIKVLRRRHIESYLLDDEVIKKLCQSTHNEDKIEECLAIKNRAMKDSCERGNPNDDVKSARGAIYSDLKKVLALKQCGNNQDTFLRDTMAKLITPDTIAYKELEEDIFG